MAPSALYSANPSGAAQPIDNVAGDDRTPLMKAAVQVSPVFDTPQSLTIESQSMDQRQLLLAAMLVASSEDAIIGKDAQSVITTWNPAAQRLYGYTAEEVVGLNISFLLPPDRIDELDAVLGRVATGAGAQHYETKRVHKNGDLIDVAMTVSPIRDPNGLIIGTSTIQRNITERKRTDTAIAEMAAIVDSSNDAIIGKTLEGVITTWNRGAEHVYGYTAAEMVGKSFSLLVPSGRPDEDRDIIAGMLASDARTDHFETQRICKDGRTIDVADLKALVQRAVAAAGEDAQRPIEVAVSEALPLLMVDTDAILQVLTNFLSNARKYSPDGGGILVTTQVVGDMVEINIQDHGLGIPPDAVDKLFGTFYRIESGDHRVIKGTGLGLAINRRIIEAHGGQVAAFSDGPGHGSRFQLTLPVVQKIPEAADILIVEDDTGFARLLHEQFVARGMTTVRTADAETAERLLKGGMRPRAVVADLVLPGVQGEEFVTRLGAGDAVPVLVLTVKNLAPAEISALEKVGVIAVMPKEAGASQAAVSLITDALVDKVSS